MENKNTQDFQLSYKFARENGIFISGINENNLEVLTSDDVKLNKLSQLEAKFKKPLVIKSLSGADFFKHISSFYSENTDKSEDIVDGLEIKLIWNNWLPIYQKQKIFSMTQPKLP